MKRTLLGLLFVSLVSASASVAFAQPTRDEAYRSDKLNIVVYKDDVDPNTLWYLPPVKLYEDNGKVVYYKRASKDGTKVSYYFYVVAYMSDDLMDMLAGELPQLQDRSQLKPVVARQFGIQVKQFNAAAMGDKITDFHYLNQPQLIKFDLNGDSADEFDFFLHNKPGIQANVLFEFASEQMDKFLNISLSFKEVYNALNIGATGKYTFTQAEISSAMENYLSQKYYTVKSKGDLQTTDVINKVIQECFTPFQRESDPKKNNNHDWQDWSMPRNASPDEQKAWDMQVTLDNSLLAGAWDPSDSSWDNSGSSKTTGASGATDWDTPSKGSDGGWDTPSKPSGSSGSIPGIGGLGDITGNAALQFTFKKELANSDKQFYYSQQHYADTTDDAEVPVYLSLLPSETKTKVMVTPLETKQLVVEADNTQASPVSTGIMVEPDQQYIVTASFAMQAVSSYDKTEEWYRWQAGWDSPDGDLYYRVGNGPWNKVGGRTVVKAESIYHGELQFYLDREAIFNKIPADYKKAKMLGAIPAIFTFQKTLPQFNVVVTGRQVESATE